MPLRAMRLAAVILSEAKPVGGYAAFCIFFGRNKLNMVWVNASTVAA